MKYCKTILQAILTNPVTNDKHYLKNNESR